MRFHLPSFLLGCLTGATAKALSTRLRPVAVEVAAVAYQVLDVVKGHAARRREDLEDLLAEARARAEAAGREVRRAGN
jgi:hypothetical protein